jgi:serine/threonine protein kinase
MNGNADLFRLIEARQDIGGRFTNLHRKGAGHFSLVLEAIDSQTRQKVAVKVFHPHFLGDVYRVQCFNREEEILKRITGTKNVLNWVAPRSDFTVTLTDRATGISYPIVFPYFVVELASGDVETEMRGGGWDAEQKLRAFREMCKAVRRIHQAGICHRDIKPSNFLVFDGTLKLSDFGTARDFSGSDAPLLQRYEMSPGDTRYTAPELLALLHDAEPRMAFFGDFFSLGATFFEMWTGVILNLQIFDANFMSDLRQSMNATDKSQRPRMFLGFIQNMASAHPLPTLQSVGGVVPPSINALVEDLYQSLAALDYRKRLRDFDRVFLRIDQCLLVLKNEEKVQKWQRQKELYRLNREENARRAENRAAEAQGNQR